MKRALLALSTTLLLLTGCTQDTFQPEVETTASEFEFTLDATMADLVPADEEEATNGSVTTVVRLTWQAGDRISAINLTTGKALGGDLVANESGTVTTFSGTLKGSVRQGDKVAFLYPSQGYTEEQTYQPVTVDFSSQTGHSNSGVPYCVYSVVTAGSNTFNRTSTSFKFLMSYIQMNMFGLEADSSIDYITVDNIGNGVRLDINGSDLSATSVVGTITMTPPASYKVKSDGSRTFYLSFAESPAVSERVVKVSTENDFKACSWTGSKLNNSTSYTSNLASFEKAVDYNYAVLTGQLLPGGIDKTTIKELHVFVRSDKTTDIKLPSAGSPYKPVYFEYDGSVVNLYTSGRKIVLRNMARLFYEWKNLEYLDMSHFDTSEATSLYATFYHCESLESLDLSHFNTSGFTDMAWAFCGCHSLTKLDLSRFDTSNTKEMSFMFNECWNITSLDLSTFDTHNVVNMEYMFANMYKLEHLKLFDMENMFAVKMNAMFYRCAERSIMMEIEASKSVKNHLTNNRVTIDLGGNIVFHDEIEADDFIATDTFNAGRNYQERGGAFYAYQNISGSIKCPGNDVTLVYGLHFPKGMFRVSLDATSKPGWSVRFIARLRDPNTGDILVEHQSTLSSGSTSVEILPAFRLEEDMWYILELKSLDGEPSLAELSTIRVDRNTSVAVEQDGNFKTPYVCHYYTSTDPQYSNTDSYEWIYHEVMIPEEYVQPCTYASSGGDHFYMGIQLVGNNIQGYHYAVNYSVWDSGDMDEDPNLHEEKKAHPVAYAPGVDCHRFGGEGTGIQSFIKDAKWKPGDWVQFVMNITREQNTSVLTVWYKTLTDNEWNYISTVRMGSYILSPSYLYNFIENWYEEGGEFKRMAYFRRYYGYSASLKKWIHFNKTVRGAFSTQRDNRIDGGIGTTSLYDGAFYLWTGGFSKPEYSDTTIPLKNSSSAEIPYLSKEEMNLFKNKLDSVLGTK